MSRSYRHTPKIGITVAESEKEAKRHYNRRYRRAIRRILSSAWHDHAHVLPQLREYSDVWAMDKDGKRWFDENSEPALLRK